VVSLLSGYQVRGVRAGAGHTLVMCTRRESASCASVGASSSVGAGASGVGGAGVGAVGSGEFGVPPLAPGKAATSTSATTGATAKSVSSKYDAKGTPQPVGTLRLGQFGQ
jgi:hypothetical protein